MTEDIEMGYANKVIRKKFKHIEVWFYRIKSEWFLIPTIIYGASMKIYKPSISIVWLRCHFTVMFN